MPKAKIPRTYCKLELTEGRPVVYIPVCKDPKYFAFTFGPLGYVRDGSKNPVCPKLVQHAAIQQ